MNSRTFTAGWLVSAALLSSWAVSSASDQPRPGPVHAETPRAQALPDISVEVDAEIARLTARMAAAVPKAAVVRDPFTFGRGTRHRVDRAAAVSKLSSPSVYVSEGETSLREADALPVAAKQPTLSGIAELTAGSLTAVISFGGELHYVRKGDVIAGRYRVDAIAMDGADVFDLTLGTISRLKLQA